MTGLDPLCANLVVWKFGASALAGVAGVRAVAERLVAARRSARHVVAVLAAMDDSTDDLVRLADEVSSAPERRELDALLSVGECVSCALTAMAVRNLGARAVSLAGDQAGVATDASYGAARLLAVDTRRIGDALADGAIVLVAGAQGTSNGDVTRLGRDGADSSAVALAAALGIRRCDVFTELPGVFTADPRIVPAARSLPVLGAHEMRHLAEGGAGVLQSRAVELAEAHGVEIRVRSMSTDEPGTWIRPRRAAVAEGTIVGLAHRRRELLYAASNISPAGVSSALGRRGAAVGTLLREGTGVRFTVPGHEATDVTAAIATAGAVITAREDLGAVSVVGRGIGARPEFAGRARAALERSGIEAQAVTTTFSRVACHLSFEAIDQAARVLHDAFGLSSPLAGAQCSIVSV